MTDSIKLDKLAELNNVAKPQYELHFHSDGAEFYNGEESNSFKTSEEFFEKADALIDKIKHINESQKRLIELSKQIWVISKEITNYYSIEKVDVKFVREGVKIIIKIKQDNCIEYELTYTMSFKKDDSHQEQLTKVIDNLNAIKSRVSRSYSLDKLLTELKY
jgi:hypothetical protein